MFCVKNILRLAEKNIDTIMPGFTHLKNAQAISFAHYLMAYVEMFSRDKKRFANNLDSLYAFSQKTMLQAVGKSAPENLNVVGTIIADLSSAWDEIKPLRR